MEENMSEFIITTEHGDGLASLGARIPAGSEMTKYVSHIYTQTGACLKCPPSIFPYVFNKLYHRDPR